MSILFYFLYYSYFFFIAVEESWGSEFDIMQPDKLLCHGSLFDLSAFPDDGLT